MPEKPDRRVFAPEEFRERQLVPTSTGVTDAAGGAGRSSSDRPDRQSPFLEAGTSLHGGRFVIRQALGMGGMGVVYEAYDRLLECPVALKTLLEDDPKRLLDLKREFRSLEGLSHPNLVKLGDLFEDRGFLFFSMERVHGQAFTRYVRPDGVDAERLYDSLFQLTHGLMALHEAGKVHRDVKPSNTLVEATGRVVLLDFGLSIDAPFAEADCTAGTVEYMAPEQIRGQVSAAADWYALGVMLYESLTGRLPFAGSAPDRRAPAAPMECGPNVPPELLRLCLDMLETKPENRPSGAGVLERLARARAPGTSAPTSPAARAAPGARSSYRASVTFRRPTRSSRKFVGRRNELDQLESAFADASLRGPVALFVYGEPGVGKSALLSEFCAGVQQRALVLSSRCHENEFLAHKALDGIVDRLFEELDEGPLSLVEGLPAGDRSALVQVFPVLRPLFRYGVPDDVEPDSPRTVHSARRAAFRCLRILLTRLGQRIPLVLVIDDLQWADVDSLQALEALMGGEHASPWLLLMAARTGTEVPHLETSVRQLALGALDADSATELARSLLGEEKPNAVNPADLADEAGRLPLFVEMLAYYSSLEGSVRSVELEALLRDRLHDLTDSPKRVLELIGVAGRPVDHKQLCAASGLKLASVVNEVRDLQIGHWVVTRQRDGDTIVEPFHDSVRSAVVDGMTVEQRRRTHRDWATALERTPERADPETLASHWESAGEPDRAFEYAVEGARRAERALAFDHAARLYGWALRLSPKPHPRRLELNHLYARSLSDAGRARDAATAYLEAGELAEPGERWGYQLLAAEQLLRAGHVDEGLETVNRLLHPLGMKLPSHPLAAMARLLGERLLRVEALSLLASRVHEPRGELMRKADACYAVAVGLAHVDPFTSSAFTARYMRYAHLLRDEQRVLLGLCLRAPQAASPGPPAEEAHAMLARVRAAVGKPSGKSPLEAHLALAEAGVAFLLGDFHVALGRGRAALSIFERLPGSTWETATAQRFVLTSLWHTGQLKELERQTKELAEDADERKDRYTANQLRTTVLPIVHLKNDEPERALSELERADRDLMRTTSLQRWQHRQHASLVALYLGRPDEVLELMKQQEAGVGRLMLNRVAAMRISTAYHRATAILATMASEGERGARGRLGILRRDIRTMRREKRFEHIPCLLEAQLAYLDGDGRTAAELLENAERLFWENGMGLFASVCAWGRSALGMRDPAHRLRAEQWMREQEIKNPQKFVLMLSPAFAR